MFWWRLAEPSLSDDYDITLPLQRSPIIPSQEAAQVSPMNVEPDPQLPLQPRPPLGADRLQNCFLLVHEFGVIDQKLLPAGLVLGLVLSLRRPRLVIRLEEVLRLLPNELLSLSLGLASLDLASSRPRPVIVIVISLIFVCISISVSVRVVVVVVVLIATTTIVASTSRRLAVAIVISVPPESLVVCK